MAIFVAECLWSRWNAGQNMPSAWIMFGWHIFGDKSEMRGVKKAPFRIFALQNGVNLTQTFVRICALKSIHSLNSASSWQWIHTMVIINPVWFGAERKNKFRKEMLIQGPLVILFIQSKMDVSNWPHIPQRRSNRINSYKFTLVGRPISLALRLEIGWIFPIDRHLHRTY